jgi:uracil-DNA glycosylase family 4
LYINCGNYKTIDERNDYILRRVSRFLVGKDYFHKQTDDYSHTFFNPLQSMWESGRGFLKNWTYTCASFNDGSCSLGKDHKNLALFGQTYDQPTSSVGSISSHTKYIFIGEAPGYNGCGKTGIPFYDDKSGNLMQNALDKLGIHPTTYYMTNVVKCCPENNKLILYGDLTWQNKLECVLQLRHEIQYVRIISPNAKVIAIGKVAQNHSKDIHNSSGMYHPAYYCRMGCPTQFVSELRKLIKEVN